MQQSSDSIWGVIHWTYYVDLKEVVLMWMLLSSGFTSKRVNEDYITYVWLIKSVYTATQCVISDIRTDIKIIIYLLILQKEGYQTIIYLCKVTLFSKPQLVTYLATSKPVNVKIDLLTKIDPI